MKRKIKCGRCGYVYKPMFPEKQVIVMKGREGRTYSACRDCLCMLGSATEEDRMMIIESFEVENDAGAGDEEVSN